MRDIGFKIFVSVVLLLIALALYDGIVIERRAFSSNISCLERREEPHRRFLSDSVTCVPAQSRNDTTTVRVR